MALENTNDPERATVFGAFSNLLGILHTPQQQKCDQVVVLILTPGMLHHAGPFRLHTDLAVALGECGVSSFRFDLSGIGESLGIGSNQSSLDRAASEIEEAMDWLELNTNAKHFFCFGLCSGADDAIYAAMQNERIQGVVALDGCGYRTQSYHWHRFRNQLLPKISNPKKLADWLGKRLRVGPPNPPTLQLGTDLREFPSRLESEEQLIHLFNRNVSVHFHYTGGVKEYYNYENQFADMFPNLKRIQEESGEFRITSAFVPKLDHVAFLCEHRVELVSQVCQKFNSMLESLGRRFDFASEPTSKQAADEKEAALAAPPISMPVPAGSNLSVGS